MTQVERRDKAPGPKEEKPKKKPGISRREFIVGSGAGVAGLVIGGAVGRELFPKIVPAPEAAAPAAEEAAAEEPAYKAGYTLVFDPAQCTGCMLCAVACAEKWSAELFPEQTKDMVNLEFSRIRPMRFQYVDVINVCNYCQLYEWAEGTDKFPCEAVCPEEAIITIPEGEGKEGSYGMGYKWIDREKCLGLEKCWRCAEICEDQFGSGISFDPIEKKAQSCSRCGGDPTCVKACPEPLALQWVPLMRNGRFYANQPAVMAELLYRKMYSKIRSL
ncbi:MAG: twin-arginine translocation signal domain-containing protein [Bellilinea sp.]